MNLCLVSIHAVLLAVLVVQYHNIYEVEAEKLPRYPNGNWFGSVERRAEIVQNDPEPETEVVLEKQEVPKKKKKIIKRYKKKNRSKHEKHEHFQHIPHDHIVHEHIPHEKHEEQELIAKDQRYHNIPHEQRVDASVEQVKVDFGQRDLRKNHKKREKGGIHQRKFVKTYQRESNSSESDEEKRRKPVDIIVHIKMNE